MNPDAAHPVSGKHFEPTRWSLVLQAREEDSVRRRAALEDLCQAYWYPLYAYLRRSGREVEDARDLVQDFCVRLLDGRLLAAADPARGRFRTLLLTALKNLDADARKAARTRKRGGDARWLPLDHALAEEWWQTDGGFEASPERTFDRAWGLAVMERAGRRLRAEHEGTDKAALFLELSPRLTGGGDGDDGLKDVGERLGLSEGAVKMALSRLRRRYADALRAEVAETVGSRGDVREELRYLYGVFS